MHRLFCVASSHCVSHCALSFCEQGFQLLLDFCLGCFFCVRHSCPSVVLLTMLRFRASLRGFGSSLRLSPLLLMRFLPTFPFGTTPWIALCLMKRRGSNFATSVERRWILSWSSLSQQQVLWLMKTQDFSPKYRAYLPSPQRELRLVVNKFLCHHLPRRVTLLPRQKLRRLRIRLSPGEDAPEDRKFAALLRKKGILLLLQRSAGRKRSGNVPALPLLLPAPGPGGTEERLQRRHLNS